MSAARILIADDDPEICEVLKEIVTGMGHEAETVGTAAGAIAAATEREQDLVLLDLSFPDCSDLSTLRTLRERCPDTDVIMVTAEVDDFDVVAEATRLGAFDYVPKPVRVDDIRIRVTRVMEMRALARDRARAVSQLARGSEFQDIVGESLATRTVVRQATEFAPFDIPVLITGETGTGKELIARALHFCGPRRDRPFVSINCASLPSELTERELFGHEKGAFTGAHASNKGAFEEAEDGTLFLDEIGDMNLQSQAALLHVLETGEYRSVGGRAKRSRARVVLASNQDLEGMIASGGFRKDLFFRINRIRIAVPPLRGRLEDVPVLARHFLEQMDRKVGKGVSSIAAEAHDALGRHDWPGNVRELKNEIERAYIHAHDESIRILDLSPTILAPREDEGQSQVNMASMEELQRLIEALRTTGGNETRAAELLGVHRNTVRNWMRKYSLKRE